mmetsp:Transcript_67635/g.195800  ORF Transcript_67635/g.195800 Transcript_67635/m.195800 type:complete len:201 (+) Transcript_67635:534-1136(+)
MILAGGRIGAEREGGEARGEGRHEPRGRRHGPQQRGGGGPAHASHHEQREDHPVRRLDDVAAQCGSPIENEGVHGALESGDYDAEQQDAPVEHHPSHGVGDVVRERRARVAEARRSAVARLGGLLGPLAEVLLEQDGDQDQPEAQADNGEVEGAALAADVDHAALRDGFELGRVRDGLADEAGSDCDQVHHREHQAEHVV